MRFFGKNFYFIPHFGVNSDCSKKQVRRFPASESNKVMSLEELYELVSKGSKGLISKNPNPEEAQTAHTKENRKSKIEAMSLLNGKV